MRRRDFIKVVAGSVSFWPFSARAQQVERTRLIGVMMAWPESLGSRRLGLRRFGTSLRNWVGGKATISESNFAGTPLIRT
jgi:hypothetical protein